MPTISLSCPSSPLVPMVQVPVRRDHIHFLRVSINDPNSQFNHLSSLISSFIIPKSYQRFPITVIRKIVNQLLISKVRAHLALHPVSPSHASSLQSQIASLVHSYLPFPFSPSTQVLSLPSNHYGFGFTSIPHLNASLALAGLLRDLNHHLLIFRHMSLISLADWECSVLPCIFPFDSVGLRLSFLRHRRSLPFLFTVAHDCLRQLDLHIRHMDQSDILDGHVSLSHLAKKSSR
ncbi:uncharacterized protein EI90DRAFT_2826791, partial [Cantharellus anzutake]|uniref:uncharacterized protein n=1 Tax=Cantharellus anzutake TaxID=1750568 RepID=UPI0019078FEB